MSNGLVVAVTIGDYDEGQDINFDEADIDCRVPDLRLKPNIVKLREFCSFLKFKFMSNDDALYWTLEDVMEYLRNDVVNALRVGDGTLNYDGLIVFVSCQELGGSIVTSDHKLIEKAAFHRLVSFDHPEILEIPRIFIFDCCGMYTLTLPYPLFSVSMSEGADYVNWSLVLLRWLGV